MNLDELKQLDESLEKVLDNERADKREQENQDFLTELIDDNVTFILEALRQQNEDNKQAIDDLKNNLDKQSQSFDKSIQAVSEAIKAVKVNTPDVVVPEIKIPDIKIPPISVPEVKIPEISTSSIEKTLKTAIKGIKAPIVNVPESVINVEVPKMDFQWPEGDMSVRGVMELAGVDITNPLPVQLRDSKGKPVDFGVGGSTSGKIGYKSVKLENNSGEGINPATEDKQDTIISNQTNGNQLTQITASDSPSIDAFGRWRVSNPETLFDSKNIFDDPDLASTVENQTLLYDNQETSGSGTGTNYKANESSQDLTVGNATAGTRIRQTKMRFNYQPGKSQEVLMTFNLNGTATGITKREGMFDDNNGLFLEADGTTINFVRRTYTSGSAVDNQVEQSNWNIDTMDGNGNSGITLDFTKTQILIIDFEWLGVGRVRMGFVIDGKIYYAHEFLNSNILDVVYMQTPNLPLRSEISNDGTGAADSLEQICSTVISEGGSQDIGIIRYASTAGTHVDANTENSIYAILGIKLKSAYIGTTIRIINSSIQLHTANHKCEWMLIYNPTVAGTFTYSDQTNSAVQVAKGATANTITGGYYITGGFIESGGQQSGNAGSTSRGIENALRLGSLIDGTTDSIVLAVRPIASSTNVDVEGSLTWRELL